MGEREGERDGETEGEREKEEEDRRQDAGGKGEIVTQWHDKGY